MSAHSAKALATIAMMNTEPSDWMLTEITWVEEEREVAGEVTCPECDGDKYVYSLPGEYKPIKRPDNVPSFHWINYGPNGLAGARVPRVSCQKCRRYSRRWRGDVSMGTVPGLVRRKVMVGYPQWPAGTVFDSRFNRGTGCHLCNKTILKSGRVPVNTTGESPHGMWVGEACARKFLSVKIKRDADSIMEDGCHGR